LIQREYETARGTIEWPKAGKGPEEGVPLPRRGCPLPRDGVRGCYPGKIWKFEMQFGALWCILTRNLTVLQFSTFVSENIAIMFDSGIDTVA